MKKILLLCSITSILSSVNAQWTNDTLVNTPVRDTTSAATPLVASLPDGSTYISWFEQRVSGYELRMQLLDSNGYKKWAPEGILVSNYPQNSALYRYDLKTDHDGNAIVAFQDERSGTLQIVVYKIDVSGNLAWGSAGVSLIDSTSTQGLSPSIGITTHNDVVVAWSAQGATSRWIDCQRISPSGAIQWNNFYRVIDTTGAQSYYTPKLLPYGADDIQMLYVHKTGNFSGVMYTQRIDAAGNNVWPTAVQVSTKTIASFFFPEPIADNNGGFFVAFSTSNPVNLALNDVFVQHVDSVGNLWSVTGTEAANSTSYGKTLSSSCIITATNEFWVLMKLDGGGNYGVGIQKLDTSGIVLLGPNGLLPIAMDPVEKNPNTIDDAFDGIILSCSFGSTLSQTVIALKTDYTGVSSWPGTTVTLCGLVSGKDDLSSGYMVNNNLVFVWQDDRSGSGIFAQNINGDGATGITTGISIGESNIEIRFFPNPSANPTITFPAGNEKNIIVYDNLGRKFYSKKITSDRSSVILNDENNFPAGIYFVNIISQKENAIIKWIKNN